MDGRWDTPDLTALLTRARRATSAALERAFYGRCVAARAVPPASTGVNANTQAAGEAQHRRPLRPRQRLLPAVARPDDDLLVGAVRRRLRAVARPTRSTAKYRAHPRRARAAAGRAHPRDRLRLGRLRRGRRARRLPRHRPVAVRRADRVRARAHRARRPRRPRASSACRTTATRRGQLRRRRLDRDVRGGRRDATGPTYFAPLRARSRPAAAPASRRSPSPTSASSATARSPTSSSSTSFPAACWPRRRASAPRRRAPGSRSRDVHAFGRDYAETLQRWLAAFDARRRRDPRAGLRRALHPLLALLPRLLRRRLRQRLDRCRRSTRWSPR